MQGGGNVIVVGDDDENTIQMDKNVLVDMKTDGQSFKVAKECHLAEKISNNVLKASNIALKPTFSDNMLSVGKETKSLGKNVKNTIARLNANILPQKKQYSPPSLASKHSKKILPNKSQRKGTAESQSLKGKMSKMSLSQSDKKKSLMSPKIVQSPRIKSANTPKSIKKLGIKRKDDKKEVNALKDTKIRKIIEFFEPVGKPTPTEDQKCLRDSDVVVDGIVDAVEKERAVVRNAFSILMHRGDNDASPKRNNLKRLGEASIKRYRREKN